MTVGNPRGSNRRSARDVGRHGKKPGRENGPAVATLESPSRIPGERRQAGSAEEDCGAVGVRGRWKSVIVGDAVIERRGWCQPTVTITVRGCDRPETSKCRRSARIVPGFLNPPDASSGAAAGVDVAAVEVDVGKGWIGEIRLLAASRLTVSPFWNWQAKGPTQAAPVAAANDARPALCSARC